MLTTLTVVRRVGAGRGSASAPVRGRKLTSADLCVLLDRGHVLIVLVHNGALQHDAVIDADADFIGGCATRTPARPSGCGWAGGQGAWGRIPPRRRPRKAKGPRSSPGCLFMCRRPGAYSMRRSLRPAGRLRRDERRLPVPRSQPRAARPRGHARYGTGVDAAPRRRNGRSRGEAVQPGCVSLMTGRSTDACVHVRAAGLAELSRLPEEQIAWARSWQGTDDDVIAVQLVEGAS